VQKLTREIENMSLKTIAFGQNRKTLELENLHGKRDAAMDTKTRYNVNNETRRKVQSCKRPRGR